MLNSWTEPGLHFMIPFITKVSLVSIQYHQVQVTLQTDQVVNIPVQNERCSVELAVELSLIFKRSRWSIV